MPVSCTKVDMVLRRNYGLTADDIKVGKRVYKRNNPQLAGIIIKVEPHETWSTWKQVTVKYHSGRTCKAVNQLWCDFDRYVEQCNLANMQARQLANSVDDLEEKLVKNKTIPSK